MPTDEIIDQSNKLDETIEQTFPASDAPANTVETGIRVGLLHPAPALAVRDNVDASRFEIAVDGQIAFLLYERKADAIVLVHTEVPASLSGRGLGSALAKFAIDDAHRHGLRIVAVCPFVRAYLRRHPEVLAATR